MAFYNLNRLFIKKIQQPNALNISILPSKAVSFLNLACPTQLSDNKLAETIKNLAFEKLSLDPFEKYHIFYEPNIFRSSSSHSIIYNVFVANYGDIDVAFDNLSNKLADYAFFAPLVFETVFLAQRIPSEETLVLLSLSDDDSFLAIYISAQLQFLKSISSSDSIDKISTIINDCAYQLGIERFDTILQVGGIDEVKLFSIAQNISTKLLTEADLGLEYNSDKLGAIIVLAQEGILQLERFNFSTKQRPKSIHKMRIGQLSLVCVAAILLFFVYPLATFEYQKQKLVKEATTLASKKSDYEALLSAMMKKNEELRRLDVQINKLQAEINSQVMAINELDRITKDGGGQVGFLVFLAKTAQEFELKLDELCITKFSGTIKTSATKHGEITKYSDALAKKGIDITIDKLQKDSQAQTYTASLEFSR